MNDSVPSWMTRGCKQQRLWLVVLSHQTKRSRSWVQEMDGSKEEVAPLIQQLLQDKAALLLECFAIEVTSEGLLAGLPQLIEGHCPDLGLLPHFVLQLSRDVDWENEKECFRGVAQVRETQQEMTAFVLEICAASWS